MLAGTTIILLFLWSVFLLTKGYPSYVDDDIPELNYLNRSVDPCQDFYEYACGNFKNEHPLSDGVLTIDQYTLLDEKLTALANEILLSDETPEDPQALRKAKSAYQACIDQGYMNNMADPEVSVVREQDGFPLVQSTMNKRRTEFSWNDIGKAASDYGQPMMFNIQAYSNPSNSTKNLLYISQTTLTLPAQIRSSRELSYEHLINQGFSEVAQEESTKGRSALRPFDIFLRKMAFKVRDALSVNVSDEQVIANINIMSNFMRGIFLGGYVPDNTYIRNLTDGTTITLQELNEWTKEHFNNTAKIDWIEYLNHIIQASGVKVDGDTEVFVYDGLPRLIYGILNLVRISETDTVKNFVLMRIFLMMAPDGDMQSRRIVEDYLRGLNVQILPRWKYCTRKLMDSTGTASLSFAVAYEYQLRYFDTDNLGQAVQMIRDIQDTYRDNLNSSDWMDQQCQAKAIDKFDKMVTILGYPDFVPEASSLDKFYENLTIYKWDNYGNTKRINSFRNAYQISQIARRDRTFWDKSPFEVNAYYNRPNNKITFPIAMLNPVFFGSKNSVLDYGRIGSIIGHEMTHGFDEAGKNYDSEGIQQQWWTQKTQETFENKTKCFIEKYNSYYVPKINMHVDGTKTLNENIADNGGARQSFRAMKKMLARNRVSGDTKNFTAEQLFFIGFATMWCNNPSLAYMSAMSNDQHAFNKWRVNGVASNMEEFSTAFSCPMDSEMNPRDKCELW
ncbi:unnamed protein product [Phaedon cochleariae]|uniref:Uncharacterized protein n=1 Tax=Phaedon cochleariae TaxID=80249 RepID=A0A9N9X0U6_PHACE|nr:unnamed protein product [Phaedon cochleariae]